MAFAYGAEFLRLHPQNFAPHPKILRGQVCLIQAILGRATAPLASIKPVPGGTPKIAVEREMEQGFHSGGYKCRFF